MIIETTEQKIIEAGWSNVVFSNLMKEPGHFTRTFGRIKAIIAKKDIEEKASPNEVCTYELFYYPEATPDELNVIEEETKKLDMNNKRVTIELKRHDVLKIQDRKFKWIHFAIVEDVNDSDDHFCRYILYGCPGFNEDFMDSDHSSEIIAVWRHDETTDNFVKIYDKEESCKGVGSNNEELKKLEEN